MTALSPPKHRAWPATSHRSIVAQASRYLGALAVLATGVAHIEQYAVDNYSTVPTIGTLFLLNFIAAIVIANVTEVATVFFAAFLMANGTGLQKIRTSSRCAA